MKHIVIMTLLGVLAMGLMGCTKPAPAPVETVDETGTTETETVDLGSLDTETVDEAMEAMLSLPEAERMDAFREQAEAEITPENAQAELDAILSEMASENE